MGQRFPVFEELYGALGTVSCRDEGIRNPSEVAKTGFVGIIHRPVESWKSTGGSIGEAIAARVPLELSRGDLLAQFQVAFAVPDLIQRLRVGVSQRFSGVP